MEYRKFGRNAKNRGVYLSVRRQTPTGEATADSLHHCRKIAAFFPTRDNQRRLERPNANFLHYCRKSQRFSLSEMPNTNWRGLTPTPFIIAENCGVFPSVTRQKPTGEATADSFHRCQKSRRFSLRETPNANWRGLTPTPFIIAKNGVVYPSVRRPTPTFFSYCSSSDS